MRRLRECARCRSERVNTTPQFNRVHAVHYHGSTPPVAPVDFVREVQALAHRLHSSTTGLAQSDRQFLKDVARGESRYRFLGLQRLMRVAARSPNAADRFGLAELVRGEILRAGDPLGYNIAAAFDIETAAEGEANNAQRLYERRRCPSSRAVVIEKLSAHQASIRTALDVIHASREL